MATHMTNIPKPNKLHFSERGLRLFHTVTLYNENLGTARPHANMLVTRFL